jgi:F-type H+-transporting ATPase subunit epsilon
MLLKIVTPDGSTYESEVDQVSVPTQTGEITVLPHHIPLVSVLKAGEIRIVKNKEEVILALCPV